MKTIIETAVDLAASALGIRVHLSNGHCADFVQSHPETARLLLDSLHPDRVFSQRAIVIAAAGEFTAFSSAAIDVIELVTEPVPDWPHYRHVASSREITQSEFRARPFHGNLPPTGPPLLFIEIEMRGGRTLFIEIQVEPLPVEMLTPLDLDRMIQQFFGGSCLHTRRRDGGVLMINGANIVRWHSRSVPLGMQPTAWPARYVAETGE